MKTCKLCATMLFDGQAYCSSCGAKVEGDEPTTTLASAALRAEIKAALREQMKDSKSLEIETAEGIATRMSAWAKLFAFFIGLPIALFLGFLTFLGVKSYSDFSSKVSKTQETIDVGIQKSQKAIADLETTHTKLIQDASLRAAALKKESDDLTKQYQSLRVELSTLSAIKDNIKQLTDQVNRLEDLLTADQQQRIRSLISIFETRSPDLNYAYIASSPGDPAGLTYGFVQATRGGGGLNRLINLYLAKPEAQYRTEFLSYSKNFEGRDQTPASDEKFKELLIKASRDRAMQAAQREYFEQKYFSPAFVAAKRIGIHSPLGIAIVLDSTTHGNWISIRDRTTDALGGTPATGIDERLWLRRYLQNRSDWLKQQPNPVLQITASRSRALLELVDQGNWDLRPPIVIEGITISK